MGLKLIIKPFGHIFIIIDYFLTIIELGSRTLNGGIKSNPVLPVVYMEIAVDLP